MGWGLMKAGLILDTLGEICTCLGCHHTLRNAKVADKDVRFMEFVVSNFMASCVESYKKACGEPKMKMRVADTPFHPVP